MNNPLKQPAQAIANDVDQLANDADTLITATAEMAVEQLKEARQRLASLLGRGLHRNLYQTLAIGVGTGVVLGYLFARRNRCVCTRE